jgi:hypothetical protein
MTTAPIPSVVNIADRKAQYAPRDDVDLEAPFVRGGLQDYAVMPGVKRNAKAACYITLLGGEFVVPGADVCLHNLAYVVVEPE